MIKNEVDELFSRINGVINDKLISIEPKCLLEVLLSADVSYKKVNVDYRLKSGDSSSVKCLLRDSSILLNEIMFSILMDSMNKYFNVVGMDEDFCNLVSDIDTTIELSLLFDEVIDNFRRITSD